MFIKQALFEQEHVVLIRLALLTILMLLGAAQAAHAQQPTTGQVPLGQALAQDFEFQLKDLPPAIQTRLRNLRTFCTERETEINFLTSYATITDLDGDRRPEFIFNLANVCYMSPQFFCKEDGSCQTELWTTTEGGALTRTVVRNLQTLATLVEGQNIALQMVWPEGECKRRGASAGCGELIRVRDSKTTAEFLTKLPLDRF